MKDQILKVLVFDDGCEPAYRIYCRTDYDFEVLQKEVDRVRNESEDEAGYQTYTYEDLVEGLLNKKLIEEIETPEEIYLKG
jgi:hypothetical protein